MPVTFYEFFCGGGMGRAGLGAGWRCTMANDNDAKKAVSYVANWSRDGLIVADVASLTTADLPGVSARSGGIGHPGYHRRHAFSCSHRRRPDIPR
jgi:site-specific DNA-cytosine methylase